MGGGRREPNKGETLCYLAAASLQGKLGKSQMEQKAVLRNYPQPTALGLLLHLCRFNK